MIPHEKELVKLYASKPFALIGLNSDPVAKLPPLLREHEITWRNVVLGDTRAELPRKWNVQSWPTIFIIDAKGVIRFRNPSNDEEISKAVEKLLAELETVSPKK